MASMRQFGFTGRRAARLIAAAALALAAGPAALLLPRQADTASAAVTDPASLVNPFIGTENDGDDFPGADAPFGMVQWSPDTTSRPDGGGYSYKDSAITGFSLTHLSGPGCAAEGDVPVLPTVGAIDTTATDSFSHSNESADAGYYSVALDNGVTTQLTATTRTGMARFVFPATSEANLIFKLTGSETRDSATSFNVLSDTEVSGSVTSGNFCGSGNTYTVYFDMQFSQPFSTTGTFTSAGLTPGARHLSARAPGAGRAAKRASGPGAAVPERPGHLVYHGALPPGRTAFASLTGPAGAYLTFDTTTSQTLLAKVGVSFVSAANAAGNLAAENPGWDFSATQTATHGAWNALLGRIQITGGTSAQQQEFYTALYHALLHPNTFSDDNGQYRGVDGAVHMVDPGHSAFYTNFSGWDIYRSQSQLEALIDPSVASDTAQSMVDDYAQDGMLPKWMENNGETYVMVGDPADSIIANYYAFGATNFDTSAALADMVSEATSPNHIRPGLAYLDEPGFLPSNGSYGCCNFYGPAATTLEYDTADFAISAFAGALGNEGGQQTFLDRAQDWQNLLNSSSRFAQPREANSVWASRFDPAVRTDFVEGDSWQYTPMVPFDLAGLIAAQGGDGPAIRYLGTDLRSFTGVNGYANFGNEPSIEMPWEYDYAGAPYQTQDTVRKIQDRLWTDSPSGIPGNDDLGTMSAWFVWSALGMYPETPGTATLALGSPMFSQAVITLPSGNTLTINGNGAADDAPYVQSATWNGGAWNDAYAPAAAITSGGTLSYTLGTSADTAWASAAAAAPPSYSGAAVPPPAPRAGPITSGVSSSLCVDDKGSSTTGRNPVQVYTCNGTAAQDWTIAVATDGTVSALGKCLDVSSSGTANRTPADLYTCNGTGAQQWQPGPDGALVNPESGKCLDDPGASTTSGTQLQIYTCNGTSAQDWRLPAAPPAHVGPVTSGVSSGLCVEDSSGGTADGNKVQIYTCNGTPAQQWTVQPDGTLRVLGGCLDVSKSGTANRTLADYWSCNGTGAQQWRPQSDGALVNPESGKCLDDPGGSTTRGTQLQIYTCNGTSAQKWALP
jgi:putative alpha-1,2-mannosidase